MPRHSRDFARYACGAKTLSGSHPTHGAVSKDPRTHLVVSDSGTAYSPPKCGLNEDCVDQYLERATGGIYGVDWGSPRLLPGDLEEYMGIPNRRT